MLFFLPLLCVKRYVYQSWYVKSLSCGVKKPVGRSCRGWACGIKDSSISEEYSAVLHSYRNGSLTESLPKSLRKLSELAKDPATCIAAQLSLFGLGGFTRNTSRAYEWAYNGRKHWLCKEVLAFHPDLEESQEAVRECAYSGSVACMIQLAKNVKDENIDEALNMLYYLGTHMISSWHKDHHGALEFATTIKSILVSGKPRNNEEWQKIASMAVDEEHFPAILWISDAVIKGLTNTLSKIDVYKLLMKAVVNGPWRYECTELADLKRGGDKRGILDYLSRSGDEAAQALISFPFMYE